MTSDTVKLLLSLLDQVSIPGSSPDVVAQAQALAAARRELIEQIEEEK